MNATAATVTTAGLLALSVEVVLRGVVAEVGQEVLFRALSNGTDVHYDWSLPGGEFLRDAGPEVRRVYNSSFTDKVNVTAYNQALASSPGRHHYPQAEAMVVVQHRLTAVTMGVEGSVGADGRVLIQMWRPTALSASVTPPEAVHDVTFYWDIDSKTTISRSPSFSFAFERKGERELSVRAENQVSSVKSAAPVRVLVVERISGVRGVAFQDSVHVGDSRTYTVQVDHGSNITYTWDFGDGSVRLVTASDAVDHVYNHTGAYDLSVDLTTPLQDHAVAAATVFVLQSGICDTPKVYGFFPKDQTEYDGTQEILLEPEIHRNCSAGGGPEYRWRVLDEGGHEALFTNYHAFFSPTLVIHPFYDSHWTKLLAPSVEKASDSRASGLASLQAHAISPFAVLADGTYTAELTIAENDTIVRAAANASFSVVAIRLKVVFTDGSAREVDARSNITLQVEVTSPTPDYDIKWGCHLLYNASEGCFPEADPWSKYTNTSDHADTVFDILHRWWETIHGGGDRGGGDGGPADAAPSGSGPRRRGGGGGGPGGARVSPDHGVIRRYYRFQQTITFPASDLRLDPADPSSRRFLFNVTVSYLLRQATAEQLITVAFGRDNFGIRINLSSQIPFGAYRRLVFESECRTCTAEELRDMKYKWNLQMMTSSSFFAYSPPPPVAEVEESLWDALRQGRPPDTFVPRPRDYLRVYNKTDLLPPRDRARGSRPAFPPPEAEGISASDLKKFPAPLSADLLARARRIFREDGSIDRALWRTLRLDLRSELRKDPAWQQSEGGRRKRDAHMGGGHEFGSGRHAPPPAAQQDLVQKSRSRRAVYPTEQERRRAEVRPAVDSAEGKGAKSVGDSSPSRNAPLYLRQIPARQPLPLEEEGHGGPEPPGGHEGRPGTRGGGDRGRDGDGEQETRDYDALAGGGMHAGSREHAEAAPGTGGKTAGGDRTKLEVLPEEEAGGESGEHSAEEEGHEAGEDAGGGGGAATERIHGREHQGRDALDTGSTRRRKNLFETNLVRDESEVRVSSLSSASPDDDDEGENAPGNSGPKETTGAAVTPDGTGGGVTPSVTQVRRTAPGESGAGSVTPHGTGQASGVDAADTRQEEAEAPDPSEPSGTPWRAGAEGGGSTGGGEDPRRGVVGAGRGEGPGRRLRSSPASPSPRDETAEHHARGASPTPALSPSNAPDADVGRSGTASTSTGAATVSGATPLNKQGPPTASLAPPSAPPPPLPAALSLGRPGDAERISPSINEHSSKEGERTRPLSADPPRRNAVNREEREKKGGEKRAEGEGEGQRKRAKRGDKDVPKARGRKERGGGEQGANKTRKRKRRRREPATPSGWGRGHGAASEGGGRGARDDGHDGPADADVGREARRPRQPAHPGHDSAHLPIRLPAPRPSPPARRAPAWPADTATAGSRPVSTPGKRLGARDGAGGAGRRPPTPLQRAVGQDRRRGRGAGGDAGDAAEPREGLRPPQRSPAKGEPVSVYPPMSWLSRLSAGRGVPQDASPASYPPLPTSSPSTPQVLDYQKYLQMKQRAQAPEHRMAPFATTSEPDQGARDSRQKHAWWGGGGGGQGREAGGDSPADAGGRARTPTPQEGGAADSPGASPRKSGYQGDLVKYAEDTGLVPDLNCPPELWRECARRPSSRNRTLGTLKETLGKPGEEHLMRNETRPPEVHILDDLRFTDVVWLTSMTSTGTREPLLVLYVNMLYSGLPYKLSLHTQNPRTNYSGTAQQLIDFSPAPKLKSCRVVASRGGPRFWASCGVASGLYRPLYLQWSYHFLRYGPKTLFYHGTRTSFDFTLPSGLEANDHKMYVSVKALDGKGVASKYQEVTTGLRVEPRFESGDGVLSLFKEISRLENESPPLLLQEVRSLAWELNLLDTTHVSQTVFDNIVALLFYQTRCKDSLETATDESVAAADDSGASILAKVNLLKSCARDHLVELVASLPIRDEMEVMQVLTALEMIVDATEYISSKTFTRVIEAMRAAEKKMGWNYNPEIRTQAAKEYFALTSEVLDKQTEIYDWASSSLLLSIELVELLLKVMEGEIRARFLEEQPLEYPSSTLKYTGYLAETEHLNRWSSDVLFAFNTSGLPHRVHLVQSLEHDRSPYYVKDDPVVSKVVSVDLHMNRDILKSVTVKLPRSKLVTESDYDFRRAGILSPQSLSVYEFEVTEEHSALAFHVLLQVVRILNPDFPVAAVVLICQSLQSLREPLYKEELSATMEAAQVQLSLEPGQLSKGTKLLIIMDKNSYENNWSRQNVSVQGADFKVAAWWSQCLVWTMNSWSPENCSVEGNLSTWDLTTCSCHSTHSTYGARSVPILSEESTIAVNELMLVETFMALYFIVLVLVLYFVIALGLQTSERHRLKRRNIWVRDNDPAHEWAYLLTIKTGTQWNAGTTSKVYAIVHGTHSMSETRELQSKQTGQLFTRGALCTFILTTAEPLGDILKVQLWHDNSGGSSAGWYVCETSVVDLVLGARYAYPCYRWLAVQAEDAKVEREITLESPTTFFQDFEHFLPQYASEHMLWTSLLTTSNTAKFYRLQRLTICLIVCLCLGTISLAVVQRINTEHTMMVPDMHIEPMYYGCIIAMALLPVQWLLEMVFKMSNRLEEKEYNNKSVLDTLRATRESEAATQPRGDADGESDAGLSDEESELYNPNSSTWTALARWAQTVELTNAHLSLLQDKDMDGMHVMQRSRTPNAAPSEGPPEEALGPAEAAARCAEGKARPLPAGGGRDAAKKCSPTIFEFLAELRRAFACLARMLLEGRRAKCKARARQEDEAGWEADEDDDDDDEGEGGEGRAASSLTFIFSQCVGWIVCCFFAAMCCMVLVVRGSGMPIDYCAVWLHIIYMTLCFSMFVMQPLVVVIYTLYKVCMYRWLGCRGCISDCVTVPLDQVVAIWNRYQTVLRGYKNRTEDMSSEKLLEERQRTRDLRFAHPPSEDYLLRCREKEAQRDKVSSVFRSVLGLLLMLALLVVIASNSNVSERYMLNAATLATLQNGSCLDREKYPECCRDSSCAACSEGRNEDYVSFGSIVTKEDWWKWASSELISLAYNSDRAFSQFSVFCDSNSVLIGWPRIRKYDINPEECEAAKYLVSSNRSLADLLHVQSCFPEYVDSVSHVFSFGSNQNKDWDAHFLAVNYGMFSQYSYTDHQQDLPSSRTFAVLLLIFLEASHWIDEKATRAVVTELTLYHPQTDLYTTVNLLAEFPSLSGAQVMVRVSSTAVERYKGTWSLVCIMAEVILVAVSMHYLYRTTIYVYKCRLKIWKSFWVFLDILMTILSWSYIVCLMLRVQIAEYIMWQLRVAYFQKYVNLKGLTTWDNILESLIGGMLLVHMIRCMRMMRYLPAFRRLGHVLSGAAKDVLVVTVMLLGMLVCCMLLGYMWFSSLLWEFHTVLEAFLTLVRIIMTHVPFLPNLENESNGYVTSLGYLYYLITYILLYQLTRALYKAAFIHAMKSYVGKPGVDVAWSDIKVYAKERCQSLLRFVQRKAEVVDEPKDNTPPDFYMAELELQINQILGGLDNLAESLGIVTERAAQLDEDDDEDDDEEFRDSHDEDEDDGDEDEEEEQPLCDRGRDWLAEGFLQGKVKSSTPKTELDVILQPLQKRVQELLGQAESGEREAPFPGAADARLVEAESAQDSPFETSFNLDAFTDVASCQTEIEAIARSWNLSALAGGPAARGWAQDDGGQLAKFLKDVSVSAASDESLQAFGKYGKTVGKLKAAPRLQPSHESLAAALRSHSTSGASDASRIRSVSSFADSGAPPQEQAAGRPRSHTSAAAAQEGPAHGSSVAMLGSRLRRTQTQGRGKGHVDVLDIESLILDSEEGSEY